MFIFWFRFFENHKFTHNDSFMGPVPGFKEYKARVFILAKQVTRVDQQAVAKLFDTITVIVTAADHVELSARCKPTGKGRIMVETDSQSVRLKTSFNAVMGYPVKISGAA